MKERNWLPTLNSYAWTHSPRDPSHDYWHEYRVMGLEIYIGKKEFADPDVIRATALLHDTYASVESYANHAEKAAKLAQRILPKIGFPQPKIALVVNCIGNHEIYDWARKGLKLPIEDQVFQDADRLDAMGAVGIARCFSFGGEYRRPIWTPGEKPGIYYKHMKTQKSSVTHFYEKLLRLKDAMNTPTGKEIAKQRHRFMGQFLDEFFSELKVEK